MIDQILDSINRFPEKNSFFIQKQFYTYEQLKLTVSGIKNVLMLNAKSEERFVAFLTYDDFETYCSAVALLFTNHAFVPVNPENPIDRNISIFEQAEINTVLSSKDNEQIRKYCESSGKKFIITSGLDKVNFELELPNVKDSDIAYLLFTSGSTGIPKGVPLSRKNLYEFMNAFFYIGYDINENDRVLQMFDMTFDLSLMSYLVPLMKGACVYTVPPGGIKYTHVYTLLEEEEITVALLVPSIIAYLRPYFEEIRLEKVKYSMFCGEALYEDIAKEWQQCVPNALVQNVYGPTEATIFCLTYDMAKNSQENKSYNGIVCIGKPMQNMNAIVVDDKLQPVPTGEKGELCLAGYQLTLGYWKNEQKNKEAFFTYNIDGSETVFYRTGDIAFIDESGDFMFSGRLDHQIKIQGFRVELSEIEHHAREFTKISNVAAVTSDFAGTGNVKIHLFIENFSGENEEINEYLGTKVPKYMIPSEIRNIKNFPLNVNGKIDRKALLKVLEN